MSFEGDAAASLVPASLSAVHAEGAPGNMEVPIGP